MPLNLSSRFQSLKNSIVLFVQKAKNHGSFFMIQLLFIVIVGGLVLFFVHQRLRTSTDKMRETRAAIGQFQERVNSLNLLKTEYIEMEPKVERLESLLVNDDTVGDAIVALDELAESYAMPSSTRIGNKTDSAEGNHIVLTITTKTSIDTLKRYIKALEELPFLVEAQSVKFTGNTLQPGDIIIGAKLFTR